MTWSGLGSGLGGGVQDGRAFAAFDSGSGPALYVGGNFSTAGGIPANNIARWNGSSWSAVGSGTAGEINSLATFNDGSGEALYVGGTFTSAGGVAGTAAIARWRSTGWSSVGGGVGNGVHDAMTVYNSPTGFQLIASGGFTVAGGIPANHIAAWNGTAWSALGAGLGFAVDNTFVHNDGSGLALYAAGGFTTVYGGVTLNHIAKWNGTTWSALGTGANGNCGAMASFNDGTGNALYVGGTFSTIAGTAVANVARWSCAPSASVTAFGNGCAGSTAVTPTLSAPQLPSLGNSLFSVTVGQGLPGQTAYLFVATGVTTAPVLLGGYCPIHLDPTSLGLFLSLGIGPFPAQVALNGSVSYPLPIPSTWSPGTMVALQAAITDPANWPVALGMTNALLLTLN